MARRAATRKVKKLFKRRLSTKKTSKKVIKVKTLKGKKRLIKQSIPILDSTIEGELERKILLLKQIDSNRYMDNYSKTNLKNLVEHFFNRKFDPDDKRLYITNALVEAREKIGLARSYQIQIVSSPDVRLILSKLPNALVKSTLDKYLGDERITFYGTRYGQPDSEIYFTYNVTTGLLNGDYYSSPQYLDPERAIFQKGVLLNEQPQPPQPPQAPQDRRRGIEDISNDSDEEEEVVAPPARRPRTEVAGYVIPENIQTGVYDEELKEKMKKQMEEKKDDDDEWIDG